MKLIHYELGTSTTGLDRLPSLSFLSSENTKGLINSPRVLVLRGISEVERVYFIALLFTFFVGVHAMVRGLSPWLTLSLELRA